VALLLVQLPLRPKAIDWLVPGWEVPCSTHIPEAAQSSGTGSDGGVCLCVCVCAVAALYLLWGRACIALVPFAIANLILRGGPPRPRSRVVCQVVFLAANGGGGGGDGGAGDPP
jgi:hypothetical protein